MRDRLIRTAPAMGTVVTIEVVGHGASEAERAERSRRADRALEWFRDVEACCSRFDDASELRRLTTQVGSPVPVSAMLFAAVEFALAVARETRGAFDPTVGARMEQLGFDRHWRSGERAHGGDGADDRASWHDVELDAARRTVTLAQPLLLDLGAVAKGLAVDAAARELEPLGDFAIDAGGDLYLAGRNADGEPWSVGIRHPRGATVLETLRVSGTAVCTSGDYERPSSAESGAHHIVDPRSGKSAAALASVTVLAASAMAADALATAAFVLGPVEGAELLDRHGARGIFVTPSLERFETGSALR